MNVVIRLRLEEIPPDQQDCTTDGCLRDAEMQVLGASDQDPKLRYLSPALCWPCAEDKWSA